MKPATAPTPNPSHAAAATRPRVPRLSLGDQKVLLHWNDLWRGTQQPPRLGRSLMACLRNLWHAGQCQPLQAAPPVDVLFLHTYDEQPRLQGLVAQLARHGLTVRHERLDLGDSQRDDRIRPAAFAVLPELFRTAAYARALIEVHRPAVVVTLEESLILSPFLRSERHGRACYVNLAHGVVPNETGHSMTDFDYFFVFGESSLHHLRRNPVRIGTTRVVMTGSPYVEASQVGIRRRPPRDTRKVLYASSWLTPSLREMQSQRTKTVLTWAQNRPDVALTIKLHPLEDPSLMRSLVAGDRNVTILDQQTDLFAALADADLLLHQSSNSSVEAALLGIPSLVILDNNAHEGVARARREYLEEERFFGPAVYSPADLNAAFERVSHNDAEYVARAQQYANHHHIPGGGVENIARQLAALCAGRSLEGEECRTELSGLGDVRTICGNTPLHRYAPGTDHRPDRD